VEHWVEIKEHAHETLEGGIARLSIYRKSFTHRTAGQSCVLQAMDAAEKTARSST